MVKYTIPFISIDGKPCRVDISKTAYTDEPIPVRAVEGNACIVSHDGDVNNPFEALVTSSVSIAVRNEAQIDMDEIMAAQDKEFKVELYIDNTLEWTGYLVPEGVERTLLPPPYDVTLTAIDGLNLLEDIPFSLNDVGFALSSNVWCPLSYIRMILCGASNLGIALPIRWTNNIDPVAFTGDDMFSGRVSWGKYGEVYVSPQPEEPNMNCLDILVGFLESTQCRLYQWEGKWLIRRVNDIVSGTFTYNQISATPFNDTITSGEETKVQMLGSTGFKFQNEDQYVYLNRGYSAVKTVYKGITRENLLPNGSMELVAIPPGVPFYWALLSNRATVSLVSGLNFGSQWAVRLKNVTSGNDYFHNSTTAVSTGYMFLPIDTRFCKRISFGFTFSPVAGFETYTSAGDGHLAGDITWLDRPFSLDIRFNDGTKTWYLTDFGTWTDRPYRDGLIVTVPGLQLGEIAQINFDKFQGILLPDVQNFNSSQIGLSIGFRIKAGQEYILDDVYITSAENDEIFESEYGPGSNNSVMEAELLTSSSISGFIQSNYMTGWSETDTEYKFSDGSLYTGSITGLNSNARMRFLYKASRVFSGTVNTRGKRWSFDNIFEVETFLGSKFLPLKTTFNVEKCTVNISCMECRNDVISLSEKVYGSDKNLLSN